MPGDGHTPLLRCVGSPAALKTILGRSRVVRSCVLPSARAITLMYGMVGLVNQLRPSREKSARDR